MKVSEYLEKKRKENGQMENKFPENKELDKETNKLKYEKEKIRIMEKEFKKKHGTKLSRSWKGLNPWVRADIIQTSILALIVIISIVAINGNIFGVKETNVQVEEVEETTTDSSIISKLLNLFKFTGKSVEDVTNDTEELNNTNNTIVENITEDEEEEVTPINQDDIEVTLSSETRGTITNGETVTGGSPFTFSFDVRNTGDSTIECLATKKVIESNVFKEWGKVSLDPHKFTPFRTSVGTTEDFPSLTTEMTAKCNTKGSTATASKTLKFTLQ